MAVKVLLRRRMKEDSKKGFTALLIKMRGLAMGMEGYISTETLSSIEDPRDILLLSMWRSKQDWDHYFNSDARREADRHFAEVAEGETQYEFFQMGM